jgi:hypothetical protein
MSQTLVSRLGLSNIAAPLLDKDAKGADEAEEHRLIEPHQHTKTSMVYRRPHGAALGAPS